MTDQRNLGAAAPTGINTPFWGFVVFVAIMGAEFYILAWMLGREYVFWPPSFEFPDWIVVVWFFAMITFYVRNLRWAARNLAQALPRALGFIEIIGAILIHIFIKICLIKLLELEKSTVGVLVPFFAIIALIILFKDNWKYKFG